MRPAVYYKLLIMSLTVVLLLLSVDIYAQTKAEITAFDQADLLPVDSESRLAEIEHTELASLPDKSDSAARDRLFAFWRELGINYFREGRYSDAEQVFLHMLAIIEQSPDRDYQQHLFTLNNLAQLCLRQKRMDETERYYRQALAIAESERDVKQLVAQLYNIAELSYKQGRFNEATLCFQRILAIYEHSYGPYHPDIARILNNLAALHFFQKRYSEAEALFQRALLIYEREFGLDSPQSRRAEKNYRRLLHTMRKAQKNSRHKSSTARFLR